MDGMAEHWTEDFVLELPYADPPLKIEGKEAVRAYLRQALGTFAIELSVTDTFACPERDAVVAEYVSEGHVTSTRKPYANRYIGVFLFRGDKIHRQREFYNPLPAARALDLA